MDIKLEDIHVTQYLYVLVKRVWLIILCFVLILVFTFYLTYRQVPIYQSAALLYAAPAMQSGIKSVDQNMQGSAALKTEVLIIKSDPIANMIIDALNLEKRLAARLTAKDAASGSRDEIIKWLKETVEVTPTESDQIFSISAKGEDPQLITDVVNSACDQFIIYTMEMMTQNNRKALQWYQERLEELEKKVTESKKGLIDFIDQNKITIFDGTINVVDPSNGGVTGSNPLMELRAQRTELVLEQGKQLQRYTPEHPKVREIQGRIQQIEQQIGKEEASLTDNNKKFIEFDLLRAKAKSDEELYNAFLRQFNEIDVADTINATSNIQVLEYAKAPRKPIAPDKVRNYLMGILFGILGGVGMAFVVEYFDDAPKSASEIEAYIGLPIVATLPKLKRSKDRSIDLISAKHPKSTEAEVMRMLRTYILFEKENPEDKVILVTSSGPKEGKSSIASNLSVSMAQANVRTLLIDADLRRPIMHRLFNLEKEIGLTDLLLGRATLDRVIKKTDMKNLYVLTCGAKVPNPAELLNSAAMKKTLLKLRSIFGQIIMDTPPTGNLADSLVIASLADSAILVYSGELNKNLLLQTKRMMEKTNIKIYGIVLNNFDTTMKGYYYTYYNKYYNRYYQTYFQEEGEEEQEMA
jgi:tyrosine-protein kinase Etk/Wzc